MTLALKNDSRLLSAEQDRIIAEQRLTEAKLEFLPEFGLQASAAKFDARYPTLCHPSWAISAPSVASFNHRLREHLLGPGLYELPDL